MGQDSRVTVGGLASIFYDLVLPVGLKISEVQLRAAGLQMEQDPFALRMEQPGEIEAKVSGDSIADFLNKKAPGGLRDFQVEVKGGQLLISATAKMIFDVKAGAVCKLRIFEGRQIFVDLVSVDVMGVGAKNLVQQQLDQVNPILDVEQFPLDVELQTVEAAEGFVTVKGLASWR